MDTFDGAAAGAQAEDEAGADADVGAEAEAGLFVLLICPKQAGVGVRVSKRPREEKNFKFENV